MSRYNYDHFVGEMRSRDDNKKKQYIDEIGIEQVLDYINQSVETPFLIEDRIDRGLKSYDRAAGQEKVIEVLALLPESARVELLEKVGVKFRAYLRVAELSEGESGRSLYFDMFNGGNFTTAWGGFRFVGIDYDWNNLLERAASYVRNAKETRFGRSKKDWFDAISKFIPEDSMQRFIEAVGPEIYANITRRNNANSMSSTGAFFSAAVSTENRSAASLVAPFGVPLSNQNNSVVTTLLQTVVVPAGPILEGIMVPNHPLPVTGVVVEENNQLSDKKLGL